MPLRLECVRGSPKGQTRGFDIPRVLLGRSREAHLQVDAEIDLAASGRHCEILDDEGRVRVRDLESTNGTYVNGDRVRGERLLKDGDLLSLGRDGPTFVVRVDSSEAAFDFERDTRTEAVPVTGSPLREKNLRPLLLGLLVVILAGAGLYFGRDLLSGGGGASEVNEDDEPVEFALPSNEADDADLPILEDPPETPLSELPPLEDWVLGRWRAAITDGATVLAPARGEQELLVEITRDKENADRYVATALEIGGARDEFAGREDKPVYRLKYLRAASERGGTAYFRVTRFDAAELAAGGDGWVRRNDFLHVDLRRGHIRGNVGVFIRESE